MNCLINTRTNVTSSLGFLPALLTPLGKRRRASLVSSCPSGLAIWSFIFVRRRSKLRQDIFVGILCDKVWNDKDVPYCSFIVEIK